MGEVETWSHSARYLVCIRQLEFFLGTPNVNWLTEQRTRTTTKKCYGLVATHYFEWQATERASELSLSFPSPCSGVSFCVPLTRFSLDIPYASFKSNCAHSPASLHAGHLPTLSVLGVCHQQILRGPGARQLPTPRSPPSFRHPRGFLSSNITKHGGFYWKHKQIGRLANLSRTQKNLQRFLEACFLDFIHSFLYCLSRQNLHCKSGSYRQK